MIKRLVWFTSGIATGVGAVIILGKRIRRRMAELTPIRIADRGVQRVRSVTSNVKVAFREGVDAMRHREQELQDRVNGAQTRSEDDHVIDESKIIVLHDRHSVRSRSTKRTPSSRSSRKI
jgi:hypothetical protein